MKKPQGYVSLQQLVPVFLVLAAGFILYLGLSDSEESGSQKHLRKNEKAQAYANEHLRRTAEQIEITQRRQALRSWKQVDDFKKSVGETAYEAPTEGADLQEAGHEEGVAKDLGVARGDSTNGGPNASDLIHQQMFEAQIAQAQDQSYREAYARQFIENARRGGWDVRLDDNFRVISVKKIRSPSQQPVDLFQ